MNYDWWDRVMATTGTLSSCQTFYTLSIDGRSKGATAPDENSNTVDVEFRGKHLAFLKTLPRHRHRPRAGRFPKERLHYPSHHRIRREVQIRRYCI